MDIGNVSRGGPSRAKSSNTQGKTVLKNKQRERLKKEVMERRSGPRPAQSSVELHKHFVITKESEKGGMGPQERSLLGCHAYTEKDRRKRRFGTSIGHVMKTKGVWHGLTEEKRS